LNTSWFPDSDLRQALGQRPLATVLVGGLFTSTTLTLFILPAVYLMAGADDAGPEPSKGRRREGRGGALHNRRAMAIIAAASGKIPAVERPPEAAST